MRGEVGVGRKSWVDIKGNAGHQSREEALSDRMLELDQIIEKQINHHHDIHVNLHTYDHWSKTNVLLPPLSHLAGWEWLW